MNLISNTFILIVACSSVSLSGRLGGFSFSRNAKGSFIKNIKNINLIQRGCFLLSLHVLCFRGGGMTFRTRQSVTKTNKWEQNFSQIRWVRYTIGMMKTSFLWKLILDGLSKNVVEILELWVLNRFEWKRCRFMVLSLLFVTRNESQFSRSIAFYNENKASWWGFVNEALQRYNVTLYCGHKVLHFQALKQRF